MKKKLLLAGTLLIMTVAAFPAYAQGSIGRRDEIGPGVSPAGTWSACEDGWRFTFTDGTWPAGTWFKVKGIWYYAKDNGYISTDNLVSGADGTLYYVNNDGAMLTSAEVTINGSQYVIDENGVATTSMSELEQQVSDYADGILAGLVNDSMTKPEKAQAIYRYVRSHMRYSHTGPRPEEGWAEGAMYGFRRGTGNCFEYYAMSHILLERAGMPNMMVTREHDKDHFWNLVNVDGVWLHFDTTPRYNNRVWCLVTTDELRNTWGSHNFDVAAYPATP